jgi:hypothetical protein
MENATEAPKNSISTTGSTVDFVFTCRGSDPGER